MTVIDVKSFVKEQKQLILNDVNKLSTTVPHLATILVGEREDSKTYVNNKSIVISDCEMTSETIKLKEQTTQEELNDLIVKLSKASYINGILLQLPLPSHLNATEAIELIDPLKDVDGLTTYNQARLFRGDDFDTFIQPCTPLGITKLLEHRYIIDNLVSSDVVVIGRSNLLGNPLAQMLMRMNCNVTQLHSKSIDIPGTLEQIKPNIICLCTGQEDLLTGYDILKHNIEDHLTTVIDAGIIRNKETGKLRGDFRKEDYYILDKEFVSYTTVPGGIGLTTTTMLAYNLLKCYKLQQQK